MTDRPRRARRVQLSTPGSSEKMMQKASESKADHVFLDLEDAVAPSQKREARKKIVQALKTARHVYCLQEGRVSLEGEAGTLTREKIAAAYFGV